MSKQFVGEVIAAGDEITSGKLLDTNSQWLSQRLSELGVSVRFHSTVGDRESDYQRVLRVAVARADIIVCTGGLGPTEDDLTAAAVAQFAAKRLEFDEKSWAHIESIFARRSRPIVPSNRKQALRPEGSQVIFNPYGTAPGFALTLSEHPGRSARFFALPGVPAEMREMWPAVAAEIQQRVGQRAFFYHSLHCFGAGESEIESKIPAEIMRRDRDPIVGITASQATITLRVGTAADTLDAAREAAQPTIQAIRAALGDYVFGENDETLERVVSLALTQAQATIAIVDLGLDGDVCLRLRSASEFPATAFGLQGGESQVRKLLPDLPSSPQVRDGQLVDLAQDIRRRAATNYGLAIGPLPRHDAEQQQFDVALADANKTWTNSLSCAGHPAIRLSHASKSVLNFVRLSLKAH